MKTHCDKDYLRKVAPSEEFMDNAKLKLLKSYGITGNPGDYAVDHLIPIELGGNLTAMENLWLQKIKGDVGFLKKDELEKKLYKQVCNDERGMRLTQSAIASDWTKVE